MSTDFSHLKQFDVTASRTAEFTLHQITWPSGGSPTLVVTPATEANKPYFNALLKRVSRSSKAVRAGKLNAGMISENRDEDRALFPRHVVKDWHGVEDAEGNEVSFSAADCEQFLVQLPDWMFDELRDFASNPTSFVDDIQDPGETAKNSVSGSPGS
jgi:hypothetical protein